MVLGIISVHYSRNIYLKINCIFNTLVLPTMYITNDLVESLYFDFYSLTFCYATVIPLLIIFLTCTFVWPLNIIAVLGAGTKYHTLIDICEEKNCNLYTYCLMHYYLTCSKNHGTKQMNKRNLQTLVYIATVKRSLLQLSQMLFLLQSTYLRKIFFLSYFSILPIPTYYHQSLKSTLRMKMSVTIISNIPTSGTVKTTWLSLTGKAPFSWEPNNDVFVWKYIFTLIVTLEWSPLLL